MIGAEYSTDTFDNKPEYTGVKVPQFSFNRLANADNRLGTDAFAWGSGLFWKHVTTYLKALCE